MAGSLLLIILSFPVYAEFDLSALSFGELMALHLNAAKPSLETDVTQALLKRDFQQ